MTPVSKLTPSEYRNTVGSLKEILDEDGEAGLPVELALLLPCSVQALCVYHGLTASHLILSGVYLLRYDTASRSPPVSKTGRRIYYQHG